MGGLTNHTYHVYLDDNSEYVIRIPGEDTEKIINRIDEKISNQLACDLGIDAKLLCFKENGSKVSEYIIDSQTMSQDIIKTDDRISKIANVLKTLHDSGKDTKVQFEVFKMAEEYENVVKEYNVEMFPDYYLIKKQVMAIKNEIDKACKIKKVPCHNDPLCENWIECRDRMYLIDWEYAGMNDVFWDLADISIEANFSTDLDELLLSRYLERQPNDSDWRRFMANKLYVDFLWTLWAKARVPFDEKGMNVWAEERYDRLKQNLARYLEK